MVIAFLVIRHPGGTLTGIVILLGIWAILFGVIEIVGAFSARHAVPGLGIAEGTGQPIAEPHLGRLATHAGLLPEVGTGRTRPIGSCGVRIRGLWARTRHTGVTDGSGHGTMVG